MRVVEDIFTDQPGVQFYTGNFLDVIGKNNNRYIARSGFCLEPQNYPNSINQVFTTAFQKKIVKFVKLLLRHNPDACYVTGYC